MTTQVQSQSERLHRDCSIVRGLSETLQSLVLVLTPEGMIADLNQQMADSLRQPMDKLKGTALGPHLTADTTGGLETMIQQVVKAGQPCRVDSRHNQRWYDWCLAPCLDERHQLVGVAAVGWDITERKQAEADLLQKEVLLAKAEEIAHVGSWDLDTLTNQLTWSDEVYRIFGLLPQEFAATYEGFLDCVHPEDRAAVDAAYTGSLREGRDSYEIEHRVIRHGTGEIRFVHEKCSHQRDDAGRVVRSIGMVQDITDRKRAEAEKAALEAHNRQLQKSESLGRMAGAIAHHFNNQLQGVMGSLELAMRELGPNPGPLAVSCLNDALKFADKAAEVSRLMLAYLGQTHDRRESLDLSAVCQRSLSLLRAAMPKGVLLEADLPSPGPCIHASANQVQQVLTRLLTNAWEASAEGTGTIRLAVKPLSAANIPKEKRFPIDWQPRDTAYACLEVVDAGSGIADKHIESLFDPFFSTKFPGRGLSLAVVSGIVRAHGGVVTVESRVGCGSTFRVFWPLCGLEAGT